MQVSDDEQRDWASLPLDLLRTIFSAPALDKSKASKRAALASCKAFGRAAVRTSGGGLLLSVDRDTSFQMRVRVWRELWGEDQPHRDQVVGLALRSDNHASPERCLSELLGANERLAFVTQLALHVRGASQQSALHVCTPPGSTARQAQQTLLCWSACAVMHARST